MTDDWNVFDHSALNNPPKESDPWVKTRMIDSVDFHVWPPHDTQPHDLEARCRCNPVVEIETAHGALLARAVVHNAYDGRPKPMTPDSPGEDTSGTDVTGEE